MESILEAFIQHGFSGIMVFCLMGTIWYGAPWFLRQVKIMQHEVLEEFRMMRAEHKVERDQLRNEANAAHKSVEIIVGRVDKTLETIVAIVTENQRREDR